MTCSWLLILYSPPGGCAVPFGIALLVPQTDTLHFQFREDTDFIAPDDVEIIGAMGAAFRQYATDTGAGVVFRWMMDTLSNTVAVEGPFETETDDPEHSVGVLFDRHCNNSQGVTRRYGVEQDGDESA